jgi:hypothetical protein
MKENKNYSSTFEAIIDAHGPLSLLNFPVWWWVQYWKNLQQQMLQYFPEYNVRTQETITLRSYAHLRP